MDHIDHISNRVATSTLIGLFTGASIATYKALPLPKTALSVAASFALTSTACLIPERIIFHSSFFLYGGKDNNNNNSNDTSTNDNGGGIHELERRRLIASHIGGGIIGGTISGSLFQKRVSFNGMVLFTPIMIGVAFAELYLKDYRIQRLNEHSNQIDKNNIP